MAKCHECGSEEVYGAGQVICRECRRNILEEMQEREERVNGSRDVTLCVYYDPFRSSPCARCWFGPDNGIPIEQLNGNTGKSRCPRVTWVPAMAGKEAL